MFEVPFKFCCSAVFENESYITIKKLFNKYGSVVMGCALATTPLGESLKIIK